MKIDSIEFFREVLDDGDMELARLSLQERPELARGRSQFSPIVIATEKFNIDLVRLLLKCGADVNQTGYRDETALHVAAVNGLPDIARVLINAGANVEAKNDIGHTPLMWSTWGGDIAERIEVKELLLEMGAYYDSRRSHQNMPFLPCSRCVFLLALSREHPRRNLRVQVSHHFLKLSLIHI